MEWLQLEIISENPDWLCGLSNFISPLRALFLNGKVSVEDGSGEVGNG